MSRYSAKLLEHFNSPRNAGKIDDATVVGEGDLDGQAPRVSLYLRIEEGDVTKCGFTAFGCGVTIAACSALTQLLKGNPIMDSTSLSTEQLNDALGGTPEDKEFCLSIVLAALRDAVDKWKAAPGN